MGDSERYLINSVLRAGKILEAFSFDRPAYTNIELSKKLGLNKSTMTRLLYSLEKAGFIARDKKTAEYRLTHRLLPIAAVYLNQLSLHTEAKPLLDELSARTGETVHLSVLDGFQVLYIDKVESPQSLGMKSTVGRRVPAYCTGVGKVLLAYLSEARLDEFLATVELVPWTENTIVDPDRLKEHLAQVRRQGYGVDDVEHEYEVKCVAGPVWDGGGEVVASVSVSAPRFRIDRPGEFEKAKTAVMDIGIKLSRRLGYVEG